MYLRKTCSFLLPSLCLCFLFFKLLFLSRRFLSILVFLVFVNVNLKRCFLFLLTVFGAQRETGKAKESSNNALDYSSNRGVPFFDKVASKNVTALLGKTAYLSCRVKNLGNKTVSSVFIFLILYSKNSPSFIIYGK